MRDKTPTDLTQRLSDTTCVGRPRLFGRANWLKSVGFHSRDRRESVTFTRP